MMPVMMRRFLKLAVLAVLTLAGGVHPGHAAMEAEEHASLLPSVRESSRVLSPKMAEPRERNLIRPSVSTFRERTLIVNTLEALAFDSSLLSLGTKLSF
jgi:hypothetical protein